MWWRWSLLSEQLCCSGFDLRYANVDGAVTSWNEFVNLAVAAIFTYIFTELRHLYSSSDRSFAAGPTYRMLNRRALAEMLRTEISRMARHHRPITIAYIDVDDLSL
jgi:hypothetical protein